MGRVRNGGAALLPGPWRPAGRMEFDLFEGEVARNFG